MDTIKQNYLNQISRNLERQRKKDLEKEKRKKLQMIDFLEKLVEERERGNK